MFRHGFSGLLLANSLSAATKAQHIQRATASIYKRSTHQSIGSTLFNENRALSAAEWQTLRTDLLRTDRAVNEVNIDAMIMGCCLPDGLLDVGKSYVGFLRDCGREPNLATLGRLLRLYHSARTRGDALSAADCEDILQIFQDLQAKSTVYDAATSENMIHAIVCTHAWQEAVALLHSIQLTAKPSASAFSVVAARAFHANAPSIGWQVLHECMAAERIPKCEVFLAYWEMCQRNFQDEVQLEELNKMLRFIGQNALVVSQTVVNALAGVFQALGISSKIVNIGDNGNCSACKSQLNSVFLTNKEFKQISSAFLERVLVGGDVFVKSTPAELSKFEKFLATNAPFDCVIDGLNVAFSTGINKPREYYGKLLAAVVRHFVNNQKRVLVLGRKHMLKWPKNSMGYIQTNAKLFLTDDLSHDDPYLLYATLKSGPATDFVSRDLMRGHAHLLGADLKAIFRRWQQEHQFSVAVGSHPGRVNINEPITWQTNAHTANGTWHIPFSGAYNPTPPELFTLPSSWLCIQRRH